MLNQGDIIFVTFPFSDLKSVKKRPALIISNDNYNNQSADIIVMAITSSLTAKNHFIEIDNTDLKQGVIPRKSYIRVDKIFSLNKSLVLGKFSIVSDEIINKTTEMLNDIIKQA